MERLKAHQLYAKFNKCRFSIKEVNFLGHVVFGGAIVDLAKVESGHNWFQPKNFSDSNFSWTRGSLLLVH